MIKKSFPKYEKLNEAANAGRITTNSGIYLNGFFGIKSPFLKRRTSPVFKLVASK